MTSAHPKPPVLPIRQTCGTLTAPQRLQRGLSPLLRSLVHMTTSSEKNRPVSRALVLIAGIAMAACGGGGAGGDTTTPSASVSTAPVAEAAVAAAMPASSADLSNPDVALALAVAETSVTAVAAATPAADAQPSPGAALASDKTAMAATGVADTPATPAWDATAAAIVSTPSALSGAGAVYYVDSKLGADTNNGLAATLGRSGAGPWRSLAKLATVTLSPGDSVLLACGNVWNETLKLSASGTATSPITVGSFPAGCASQPTIDGSQTIAAGAWTLHQGNIYKAALATAPLQVSASTGFMTQAHHPNRGFDAAQQDSLYLRNAVASDKTLINSRQVSTYVTTGADLKLPAGATLTAGTKIRIRTNAWVLDDRDISAVSGTRLSLSTPTSYPLDVGWGYYLLGQLWMLDSAGEWHYDATSKQLYAWMPDNSAPAAKLQATQLATGVDIATLKYIVLDNLTVRKVGTGINLRSSTNVVVRNSRIEDTVGLGINAVGSVTAVITANVMVRLGTDAVSGQDDVIAPASGMQVISNTITDSGVAMNGQTVLNLPIRSIAAIRAGLSALVSGNNISNTGNNGIHAGANSTISNNVLAGTCSVLDDCGAIYASGANNKNVIIGNLVQNSRGALAGKAPFYAYTQGQGIYLDESASGVVVSGNTVVNADNGVQVHVSANNVVKDNKLYGNRKNQIWLQETRNTDNPLGDVFGNVITGNQIVPTAADARGLYLETQINDTSRFGSFDFNRYFDRIFTNVAEERTNAARTMYTIGQWKGAVSSGGASRSIDPNGSGTSETRFASVKINGINIVPNASLASDSKGWTAWNLTSPLGYLVRESCLPGWCTRYVTGASAGILSSPNFSVTAGTWYRMSVDLATGADNQLVNIVLRRGGGGVNGYESLSDRSLKMTAGTAWKRYSVIFKATTTVNAADPITKDMGARVDAQSIELGQVVSMANLEVVTITPADALTRNDILVNNGSPAMQLSCPVAATQPTLCANYVRLSDNLPVTWPYYLAGRSAEIIYTRDASLVDSDGDGIPDSQDRCPNTLAGVGVNSKGCALNQL